MEGVKGVIGFMVFEENKSLDKWRGFILDLRNRRMRRVLLFVIDNSHGPLQHRFSLKMLREKKWW